MAREPVRLNVYDMYWLNKYALNLGVGIFHSGIEVYGTEHAYGGHPFPFSGIFQNGPRNAEELSENFKFRESILIGYTDFSPTDVQNIIKLMGKEYSGDKYHLMTKNCNHFSNHFAKTLTGQDCPGWINRLASISASLPFVESWIPQEWLTPLALQNSLNSPENGSKNFPKPNGQLSNQEQNPQLAPSNSTFMSRWFQPRNSEETSSSGANSVPLSSRSMTNANQSFSRLWNSFKDSVTSRGETPIDNQPSPLPARKIH